MKISPQPKAPASRYGRRRPQRLSVRSLKAPMMGSTRASYSLATAKMVPATAAGTAI